MAIIVSVKTDVAFLDAHQIAIARTMQLMQHDRERNRDDWRTPRTLHKTGLWQDVRTRHVNLGQAAGLHAQVEQMQLSHELELEHQDHQRIRALSHSQVAAPPFRWAGTDWERETMQLRLLFRLEVGDLTRLLVARVLGRMLVLRERERSDRWHQVAWNCSMSQAVIRRYLVQDLRASGLDALKLADAQIRLCTDSFPKFYAREIPPHVSRICESQVRRVYAPA